MSWLISQSLMDHCASLPCSLAQAAASSEESCSAGELSVPSSTTPTPRAYLSRDKTTDAWTRFPSGMTCEPLAASRGEELLTSFRAGFRAKTSRPRVRAQGSTESEADSGQKWRGSLARYDRVSRSWKTRQCLLLGGLEEFSETWPRWGSMRGGECFLLRISEPVTTVPGCSFRHPTPCATEHKGATTNAMKKKGTSYFRYWLHHHFPAGSTTYPSQEVLECVMGFPIGWAGLAPLATPKFRLWRRSHGRSLRVAMERILES